MWQLNEREGTLQLQREAQGAHCGCMEKLHELPEQMQKRSVAIDGRRAHRYGYPVNYEWNIHPQKTTNNYKTYCG